MSLHATSSRPAPPTPPPRPHRHRALTRHLALPLMALTSLAAGFVHAAVVPEHRQWWPSAVFFGTLAVFQLWWGVLAVTLRPVKHLFVGLGVAVNAGSIALWLLSRTVGVPLGPQRGVPEAFSRTDVLAATLELILTVAGLWWMRTGNRRIHRPTRYWLGTGVAAGVVSAAAFAALAGVAGHGHTPGGTSDEHGGHDGPDSTVQTRFRE